jgi:hypothetical protein
VHIAGFFAPGPSSTANGTVSFVHFTAIFNDAGTLINVTVVTLATPPLNNTLTFCGNQTSQFPMSTAVQISFVPNPTCASLVSVTH